ncbi:MAG: chemotaxis protein CheB [Polaromonas sp.]|nr:chemotaxis protein CheB [Polaromonas sp.]
MSDAETRSTALPVSLRRRAAVVIGASAGGVEALIEILPGLPADYPLAVVVVLHQAEQHASVLPELFARRARLAVRQPVDKEPLQPGTLYFAPPGYHLLIETNRSLSLSCDAPVLFSRPSIDVLFESAADAFGRALVGVLLTGANADGAAGLARIAQQGGLTVVQDPAEAHSPDMPGAAIALRTPDFVLPLAGIGRLLAGLTAQFAPPAAP